METVKNIAASISVSAVVIGAVYIICPDGVMSRQMKLIAGLLMILSLTVPFVGVSIKVPKLEEMPDYSASAGAMISNQVCHLAKAALTDAGIEYEDIEVFMDISQSGDISIYRIYLYGVSDGRASQVLQSSLSGCEVVIVDE